RTRKYKYILNLAHQLPYPISIYSIEAPTWKMLLNQDSPMLGERTLEAYRHRPRHELFDLQTDSLELHNLAECSEHAELLKNLQNKLRQWREKTQDPWLESYEEDRPIKINFALN
ncbi:MAG: hypothetical protein JSV03_02135, partial [Planctomycetota bacterium]